LAQAFGGTASRVAVDNPVPNAAAWNDVMIDGMTQDTTIAQGNALSVNFWWEDRKGDATVTIGFDTDANPYNGTNGAPPFSLATASMTSSHWGDSVSTSSLTPGQTYRVYAKISNGTHTRYYYAQGRLIVTAAAAQATSISLSCNVSQNVAPGSLVTVSGTAAYNNGQAVPAATVTISVAGQTWTAAITNGSFSRSITAPTSPGSYTVSCLASDLSGRTGSCSSAFSVQQNGSVSNYILNGFLTCLYVNPNSPYDNSGSTTAFSSSDAEFYAWTELDNVTNGHNVNFSLYRPDGTSYGSVNQTLPDPETQGHPYWPSYRLWAYWPIAGNNAIANVPGTWSVRLAIWTDINKGT
jgi:hypothetical protein